MLYEANLLKLCLHDCVTNYCRPIKCCDTFILSYLKSSFIPAGLYPFDMGSVSNIHVTDADVTHLTVNVTFDPLALFHHFSKVLVLVSAKFTHAGDAGKHSGAAVWVKNVNLRGFTGVMQLPERFSHDRSNHIHLDYVAYQVNVHRRTKFLEGGSVDIPKWDTGSRCMHIKPKVCSQNNLIHFSLFP